jgi:glutathione S-transferase
VLLFVAEQKIPLELQVVDLFTGEHYQPPFEAINPNHLVPVLEDGGFRLTESSAILKYLADKIESPLYPRDLQARARVNERMDWVNTQLCRDLAYGTVYPQIFPFHRRPSEEAQSVQLKWGCERAQGWLKVLDQNLLGSSNPYLCGTQITIADYFAVAFVSLAQAIGSDLSAYPQVGAWLGRMKALPNWGPVNQAIDGYVATLDRTAMVAV